MDLQYIILSDAIYYSAGYVFMVETYVLNYEGQEQKQYAPVVFGSKIFKLTQLKLSIYAIDFLGVRFDFDKLFTFYVGIKEFNLNVG